MSTSPSILLVDDEEIIRDVVGQLLTGQGYRVTTAISGEECLEKMQSDSFDLILLDLMLPGMGGLATLEKILHLDNDTVVVVITAFASVENAVKATKAGAFDFITKPFKNQELLLVIKNGLERHRLEMENRQLRYFLKERCAFEEMVGKSEPIQRVYDLISAAAPSRNAILIVGESGTGKDLVARTIHSCSQRAARPFVPVKSSSIPAELMESELFGHVKGAFTGASVNKTGVFESANGGTVFLDEVEALALQTQEKLLRFLQERNFRPVGAVLSIRVDIRVIAATSKDLSAAVDRREFSKDLFNRLKVITIPLPALRQRKEDIPLLAETFLRKYCSENDRPLCKVQKRAMRALLNYDWPGNISELEHVIERTVILASSKQVITEELLPAEILNSGAFRLDQLHSRETGNSLKEMVLDFERDLIMAALRRTDWNQKRAAKLLQVNPTTLNEKLKRLHIEIPDLNAS